MTKTNVSQTEIYEVIQNRTFALRRILRLLSCDCFGESYVYIFHSLFLIVVNSCDPFFSHLSKNIGWNRLELFR